MASMELPGIKFATKAPKKWLYGKLDEGEEWASKKLKRKA